MKLHDFGLWFYYWYNGEKEWSTTIPTRGWFYICYDANCLGYHNDDKLLIYDDVPYSINLNKDFPLHGEYLGRKPCTIYLIGRFLIMDDFEIVKNPDYQEQK